MSSTLAAPPAAMTSAVRLVVAGAAVPKGSLTAYAFKRRDGRLAARITDKTRGLAAWSSAVRRAAETQAGGVFFEGAIRLAVVFYLPRPQSLPKRIKHHVRKPDSDKLLRVVLDSLTKTLWRDDSQVIEVAARKVYASGQPHAVIIIDHAAPVEELALEQDLFDALSEVR